MNENGDEKGENDENESVFDDIVDFDSLIL